MQVVGSQEYHASVPSDSSEVHYKCIDIQLSTSNDPNCCRAKKQSICSNGAMADPISSLEQEQSKVSRLNVTIRSNTKTQQRKLKSMKRPAGSKLCMHCAHTQPTSLQPIAASLNAHCYVNEMCHCRA